MAQCTGTSKTTGKRCQKDAIAGGKVCRWHGGAAPQVKARAAVRAEVLAWGLGDAVDDPGEVLLRLVTQSRMRVDQLSAEIARKVSDLGEGQTLESVLIGDTFVATQFDTHKSGEYIRGLVKLEADERDRLANFAAKAIAAGLAERQVRMAERQGEMLAAVLLAVIANKALGLTPAQQKALPDVLELELTRLQTG